MKTLPPAKYFLRVNKEITLASDNDQFGVMIERIKAVSKTDVTVLIVGETGSGKEIIAEAVHNHSDKKDKFIRINCAAIPGELLESELFGHTKGAYTDAKTSRSGKFSSASNGTLFLDEICQMDIKIQPKLLRAVETGEFYPVGSDLAVSTSARIIASANLNIGEMIGSGQLREDLYYRLSGYVINVPVLKERKEDIPRLITYFFEKTCKPYGIEDMDGKAWEKLINYDWPGNIREFQNVLEAAKINALFRKRQTIEFDDIDEFPSAAIERTCTGEKDYIMGLVNALFAGKKDFETVKKEVQKRVLVEVRNRVHGSTKHIAEVLGMTDAAVRSLYSRAHLSVGALCQYNPPE